MKKFIKQTYSAISDIFWLFVGPIMLLCLSVYFYRIVIQPKED